MNRMISPATIVACVTIARRSSAELCAVTASDSGIIPNGSMIVNAVVNAVATKCGSSAAAKFPAKR
jgi:hypothetical protein